MPVKNILVAYDGSPPTQSTLSLATAIARKHDAHLTGLLTYPLPIAPTPMGAWMAADALEMPIQREKAHAAEVRKQFDARCAAEGMTQRTSFVAVEGPPDTRFAEFARAYDLVVLGQPQGDFWEPLHEPHPDTVAMTSGRPVLVAPRSVREAAPGNGGIGEGTVLAWDGGRAAARALGDAMATVLDGGPMTVLHVGEDDHAVRRPGRDVMEHLSRHGIHAELLVLPPAGRPVAELLLEIADVSGAGLLVMGAYEHSRLGETLFGGPTRDVLRRAKIPVLVAH
jgi:nucleotide-binding universal stress UspA family protein